MYNKSINLVKRAFNESFDNDINKEVHKRINIALIGLGPHAKRIYLNYFKKHNIVLSLVVELESQKTSTQEYLLSQGFKNTKIFTVSDEIKDKEHLPEKVSDNLFAVCKTMEISHIIIATEPKAHNMYIEFALKHDIDVLTDKPITVLKNMTNVKNIEKIKQQYYDLVELEEKSQAKCNVMCQRQYHKGYEYIKALLNDTVSKYKVPITYIDIYHCDGNWEMAHDMLKENHPYKYGYGKLFHSGYHFLDLLSDFLKINQQLDGTKHITKGYVYSNCFTPNDELNIFNFDDYKRIFKNQDIPSYYFEKDTDNFKKFGEKNYYGMMRFTNSFNQTITNVNLNLLHYGFSRRGWIETRNFYKENGRIRHERLNIQVGTLLNIQVHSYQSKEIKDRLDYETEEQVGGLEHFDIDIYRNVDVIGGKPFERITLGSLYSDKEKKNILGYNELSREIYLTNFLKGKKCKGDLKEQELSIQILCSCAKGISNHYHHKENTEKICMIPKKNVVNVSMLRKYSSLKYLNCDKKLVDTLSFYKDNLEFGILTNYISEKKIYETYFYIYDEEQVASGLLLKYHTSCILSKLYFTYLYFVLKYGAIQKIIRKIQNY